MCLIPRAVAEDVGLPLPLFIKWDDAEYGLRARSRGYRTATVPGIAIWHMSFLEKDDTSDWQAYFHYRNRLVAAALHGPDDPQRAAHRHFKRTLRHLLLHGVLGGGAAAHGAARLPRGPGGAVPDPAGGAGAGPGDAGRVRRRPPARLGDPGAAEQPGRARRAGVPRAAHEEAGDREGAWPAACCTTCARPTRPTTRCRSATCRRGRRCGSCCRGWIRPRCRRPTGAASPSAAATRQLFRSHARTLGAAAARHRQGVARPAPPLPRGGPELSSREGWRQMFES